MKLFANFVDQAAEIKSEIMDKTTLGGNRSALSALKQSWRECEAIVARGIKRGAEGLQEEAIDDPLAAHVQDSIERTFNAYYHWTLSASRRASDNTLGRFRREFEQCTPTVSAALKIKSLAQASKGADSKKHRLSDDVAVELRARDR